MSWLAERQAYEAELRLKANLWERYYVELAKLHLVCAEEMAEKAKTSNQTSEKSPSTEAE